MDFKIFGILTYQYDFSHIFGMQNGIKMVLGLQWFLIPVEYIYSKITIWPPDNISLIYLCWITIVYMCTGFRFTCLLLYTLTSWARPCLCNKMSNWLITVQVEIFTGRYFHEFGSDRHFACFYFHDYPKGVANLHRVDQWVNLPLSPNKHHRHTSSMKSLLEMALRPISFNLQVGNIHYIIKEMNILLIEIFADLSLTVQTFRSLMNEVQIFREFLFLRLWFDLQNSRK